ncbi:hypothetical protein KOR42_32160 [Thalassoglobus neptunius]|uniref:Uncharacterized protein n=1 Tax=Thalassoglobus neptunius TaxID=1938619 RepID=A0A5C5WM93_9PLAN|nr:hypothetical protein [Thalassoglobus neptunius]TWT51934.1 hypothetical protein KOR42_32160 [Thalassoglobus neptunius]
MVRHQLTDTQWELIADVFPPLTAERQTEEFVNGKGVVTRWERTRRNNHWLDALYNACAAGHYVGARLLGDQSAPIKRTRTLKQIAEQKQETRHWFDDQRWQEMMNRTLGRE